MTKTADLYEEQLSELYKSPLPLTRATRCLTPIMMYTHVDGQCDKLVTDDRHQFITPTVHLS